MKKYIISLAFLLALSLHAETYHEFLARFIPNKTIIIPNKIPIPGDKIIKIKIGKIDGDKIEDIVIFSCKPDGKIEQKTTAKKSIIRDIGKGTAELHLYEAYTTAESENNKTIMTISKELSLLFEYRDPIIIFRGNKLN